MDLADSLTKAGMSKKGAEILAQKAVDYMKNADFKSEVSGHVEISEADTLSLAKWAEGGFKSLMNKYIETIDKELVNWQSGARTTTRERPLTDDSDSNDPEGVGSEETPGLGPAKRQ